MNTDTNKDRDHRMALANFKILQESTHEGERNQAEQWLFFWIMLMVIPWNEIGDHARCRSNVYDITMESIGV